MDIDINRTYRENRKLVVDMFEKSFVETVMLVCDGNITAAGRLAKIDRKYLLELVQKHEMGTFVNELRKNRHHE